MLDLAITLTPPPPDSVPGTLALARLHCESLGPIECTGLLPEPLSPKEKNLLTWYLEEFWKWPYEVFAERGRTVEGLLKDIGKRLYRILTEIPGSLRIMEAWRLHPDADRQVSIITEIPGALSIPWELLHDEQGFLVLRTRNPVSVIRRLPSEYATFHTPFDPPLRVLIVTARPTDAGLLDPRLVGRELMDEMHDEITSGAVTVEFLRPPTLSHLRERLRKQPAHILHFDGHGRFDPVLGSGVLLFEKTDGEGDPISAGDLAQVLQDSGVRLVVLTACQSAAGSPDEVFSSVAGRLIQSGVDGVTAMSASMLAVSAARYSQAFYRELSRGGLVGGAHERARQGLHDDPRRHIVHRRQDEGGTPVALRDWWLPHFFQQRPILLQVRPGQIPKPSAPHEMSGPVPISPRYGFTGRARELLNIERQLLRKRLIVIHGFGGTGKTSVAIEAATWLTRTGLYSGACFVSFEHSGDAEILLGAVGRHLDIYDSSYNPRDTEAALNRIRLELARQSVLIIVDNVESILPRGAAPLKDVDLSKLWGVLLDLARSGAGILLTTRDLGFGDGRMSPCLNVAYLPLEGLHPEDAYSLAMRILEDLSISREQVPYAEMTKLLRHLDYHPLAIQLVIPVLRDSQLETVLQEFSELLPRFVDDREGGRNRSLLTSLEYSLRRLTDQQRNLLVRLAPFEGGAEESELLRITDISEMRWRTLRPALEHASLISQQRIHERNPVPYIRFHPILTPYIRTLPRVEDRTLLTRYMTRYYALLKALYADDSRNPELARSLVRIELPNFRHALELFRTEPVQAVTSALRLSAHDIVADMTDDLSTFLKLFGMTRVADDLWARVNYASDTARGDACLTLADFFSEYRRIDEAAAAGKIELARDLSLQLIARLKAQTPNQMIGVREHARVLCTLAQCLVMTGDNVAAQFRLSEALRLFDGAISADPEDIDLRARRGSLVLDLGNVLLLSSTLDHAESRFDEALAIARQYGQATLAALAMAGKAKVLVSREDFAEGETILQQLRPVFVSLGEPNRVAELESSLAEIAQGQGNKDKAEGYYRQALTTMESIGDLDGTARMCYNLGLLSLDDSPNEARGWFKRVLDMGRLQGVSEISVLENLAESILRCDATTADSGGYLEARQYANRALYLFSRTGPKAGDPSMLKVLAEIEDRQGNSEAAQKFRDQEQEYERLRSWLRANAEILANYAIVVSAAIRSEIPIEDDLLKIPWSAAVPSLRRILSGERDRDSLTKELPIREAAIIHMVLDTLEGFGTSGNVR